MKAEILKATNTMVRIQLEIPARKIIMVSRMPLEHDPFVLVNKEGQTTFRLKVGPTASLRANEVIIPMPANQDENPSVNIALDATLSMDEIKFTVATYKEKIAAVEKQILDAVKKIEETIKTVEVI